MVTKVYFSKISWKTWRTVTFGFWISYPQSLLFVFSETFQCLRNVLNLFDLWHCISFAFYIFLLQMTLLPWTESQLKARYFVTENWFIDKHFILIPIFLSLFLLFMLSIFFSVQFFSVPRTFLLTILSVPIFKKVFLYWPPTSNFGISPGISNLYCLKIIYSI